jgi:hypothetical protein
MSIRVPIFMRISQYLDPQYFGKAWRNCMYNDDAHLNIPLLFGKWIHRETTLLWKVNTWKHGKDPSPCFTNYEEREESTTTSAFSSTRKQDGWKTRQWIPCIVNLLQWRPWKRIWDRDLTTIQSQMHKSWVWRKRSQANYWSQDKSKWDQGPASSSPPHISSPDK